MKQIGCLLCSALLASATHAVDPAEIFQHLDPIKIESELSLSSYDIVAKQNQKLTDGKIRRWGFVYFDPEPLENIAAGPSQLGWVNFNILPGLEFNVQLKYETSLTRGSWHSIYGATEIFATIAGPPPRTVTEPKKGQSPFPTSRSPSFSGRLYAGSLGNYQFFPVPGEPNLYVAEEADGSYVPDPLYDDFVVRPSTGGGHGVVYPPIGEGGSTDIDVVALFMPSLGNTSSAQQQVEAMATNDIESLNQALAASGVGTAANLVYTAPVPWDADNPYPGFLGLSGDFRGAAIRAGWGADIIVVYGDSFELGTACGIADLYRNHSRQQFQDQSWILAVPDCYPNGFVFAHEAGHLMGACHQHNDPGGPEGGPCIPYTSWSYARAYVDSPFELIRTVVTSPFFCTGSQCDQILRFSSDTGTYQGEPIGAADIDNERLIRDESAGNLSNGSAEFLGELLTDRVPATFLLFPRDEFGDPLAAGAGFVQSVDLDNNVDNKLDCPTQCEAGYQLGEVVRLKVDEEQLGIQGYVFQGWGEQCFEFGPEDKEIQIFLQFDFTTCSAQFQELNGFLLGVEKLVEDGLINSDDGLIDCPLGCPSASAVYEEPTMVALTAQGDPGVTDFVSWVGTGCQSGDPTVTVDVSESRHCEAAFESVGGATRTMVVLLDEDGEGDGDVVSTGIDCPDQSCQEDYPFGSTVVLTANAATGSEFGAWSGEGCIPQAGHPENAQVEMTETRVCTARFDLYFPDRRLDVFKSGNGPGEIESDPPAPFIDCDAECQSDFAIYEHGRTVTLRATPITGDSTFGGWAGAGCQTGQTFVDVDMTDDVDCTADFVAIDPVGLTVGVLAGNGQGAPEVAVDPGGHVVTTEETFAYGEGTALTLGAIAAGNYDFIRWLGATCPGENQTQDEITFPMPSQPAHCIAKFWCTLGIPECIGGE